MKIGNLVFAVALLVLLSACATNESSAQVASRGMGPDEITCRAVVKTGTRIGSRDCRTNRQWAARSAEARAATEQIQNESTQTSTMNSN